MVINTKLFHFTLNRDNYRFLEMFVNIQYSAPPLYKGGGGEIFQKFS